MSTYRWSQYKSKQQRIIEMLEKQDQEMRTYVWQKDNILFGPETAVIPKALFSILPVYSVHFPTDIATEHYWLFNYPGQDQWYLRWYERSEYDGQLKLFARKVSILDWKKLAGIQ